MQITTLSNGLVITLGWLIALLVLVLAILGLLGVVPSEPQVVFAFIIALAVARLI